MAKKISERVLHKLPADIKKVFQENPELLEKWESLTHLDRNEWICWITIVKKQETKNEHLKRLSEDILNGKKRPCCWPGCPHRRPVAKHNLKYFL